MAVRWTSWRVAVPPGVLTLAISLLGIGRYGLGNDEYATWHASTLSFPDLLRLLDNQDVLLGPHYLAMHGWVAVAGADAGHLRVPSAVAMACAAGLLALIGKRLFDEGTGLGAGLMFAVVPSTSVYGQEARPYAFAVAAVLLATLLLLRALDVPSRSRWAWYGAALVLIGLSHVVALTVLAAHAALVLVAGRTGEGRSLLRRWLAAAGVASVAVLPLVAKGSTQTEAINWIRVDAEAVRQLPERMLGSPAVAWVVISVALLAAVALARAGRPGGGAGPGTADRSALALLLTWAVVPPVLCFVTAPLVNLFLYRYLLFTVPAWVLLAAALPSALARSPRRWPVRVGAASGVLAVVVGLVGAPGQEAARRLAPSEPNFNAAAGIVQAGLQDGDGIVFEATRRDGRRAFRYLHATGVVGAPKDVLLGTPASQVGRFQGTECADTARCLAGAERIWLLADAGPGPDRVEPLSGRARSMLREQFDRELVGTARHLRVYLLRRDSPGPTT